MNCYCGSLKFYSNCCEKAHKNMSEAKTAEQLMRSRYSAFVTANGDYLMESHHASTRPTKEKNSIVKWAKSVEWIKLEVLEREKGTESDNEGTVTFQAYFYEKGKVDIIYEKSAFVKENDNWFYLGPIK
ncbi:MAG: YchJ family metal-binding protein [Algibacter sp.]|uniref:YchJ family protein n=1 Tax=Algibacter sp. TaxID=1872428 RepID=UPI0032997D6F